MPTAKIMNNSEGVQWHVLHAMHGKAMTAQGVFSRLTIETFVPMEERLVTVKGKNKHTKLMPMFLNLIFVKSTLTRIKEIKSQYGYLYYLTHTVNGKKEPITVPLVEMECFINFLEGKFEHIDYIDTKGLDIKKGELVKIISGAFKGKEGIFIKITGKRSKQIVVAIDGLLAVSIKTPNPSHIIEKII